MKKYFFASSMVFCFVVAIVAVLVFIPLTAEAKYTWRAQSVTTPPAVNPSGAAFQEWLNRVEAVTDGEVKFKKFWKSQLVPLKEGLDGLKKGAIDVLFTGSYFTGTLPETNFIWLPFQTKGTEHAIHLYRDTRIGELYAGIYKDYGIKLISFVPVSIEGTISTKPIRNIEDFDGIKLRSGSTLWNSMWKKMGASPVMMVGAEQYMALKQGVIDATVYPIYTINSYKFYEVAKYLSMPGIADPFSIFIFMSQEKWDALSTRLKTLITQTTIQFEREYMIPHDRKISAGVIAEAKKHGVELVLWNREDFEKIQKLGYEMWDEFAQTSPVCKEMVEILKADQEWWIKNKGEKYREWEERWLAK